MQVMREVMDLCPRGEMDRCLCAKNDTKIHFPFTLMDIMNCEPKRVTMIVIFVILVHVITKYVAFSANARTATMSRP